MNADHRINQSINRSIDHIATATIIQRANTLAKWQTADKNATIKNTESGPKIRSQNSNSFPDPNQWDSNNQAFENGIYLDVAWSGCRRRFPGVFYLDLLQERLLWGWSGRWRSRSVHAGTIRRRTATNTLGTIHFLQKAVFVYVLFHTAKTTPRENVECPRSKRREPANSQSVD